MQVSQAFLDGLYEKIGSAPKPMGVLGRGALISGALLLGLAAAKSREPRIRKITEEEFQREQGRPFEGVTRVW